MDTTAGRLDYFGATEKKLHRSRLGGLLHCAFLCAAACALMPTAVAAPLPASAPEISPSLIAQAENSSMPELARTCAPKEATSPIALQAANYFQELEKSLARLQEDELPTIHSAAAAIAAKLIAGGSLFVYDSVGSFAGEALGRAGGLMDITYIANADDAAKKLSDSSILLIGARSRDDPAALAVANAAREAGALIVAICPSGNGLPDVADHFLDDKSPGDVGVIELPGAPSPVSPTVGVLNTVVLWSLLGQTIQNMIDAGYAPRVYMSIQLPGSREYNESVRSGPVLKPVPPPPPPRPSSDRASEYIAKARETLCAIQTDEMDEIAQVASAATTTILSGHKAFHFDIGHMWPAETALERPGNPGVFVEGPASYTPQGLDQIQPGDLLLWGSILGAMKMEVTQARATAVRGITIACIHIPTTPDQGTREDESGNTVSDFATIVIDGHYPYTDGCLKFEQIPTPACPISGFINYSLYWAIAAQTAADLLAAGATLPLAPSATSPP